MKSGLFLCSSCSCSTFRHYIFLNQVTEGEVYLYLRIWKQITLSRFAHLLLFQKIRSLPFIRPSFMIIIFSTTRRKRMPVSLSDMAVYIIILIHRMREWLLIMMINVFISSVPVRLNQAKRYLLIIRQGRIGRFGLRKVDKGCSRLLLELGYECRPKRLDCA